jgi:hypothetical protein
MSVSRWEWPEPKSPNKLLILCWSMTSKFLSYKEQHMLTILNLTIFNHSFSTIVAAVEEGRHVFDNILKFIVYLLSCNGAEIFLMLICTAADIETPLTVMMILWANIIGMFFYNYTNVISCA